MLIKETVNMTNSERVAVSNTNNQYLRQLCVIPMGIIYNFVGEDTPNGYLICDGSSLSRVDYPDLYEAIGYKYGGSDDTFKLPTIENHIIKALNTEINGGYEYIDNAIFEVKKELYTGITKITEEIKNANKLVSNALKGTLNGEVVAIKDVSPLEHTVKVKLDGDNIGGEVLTKTEVLATKGDSVLLNNPSKSVRIVMIGGAYCVGGVIPLVDGDDLTQLDDFTDIAIVPQGSYAEAQGIRDITYRIEGNTFKWEGFGGIWYQNELSGRFDISGEYTLNSSECNIIGFYQVYALDESNPNYQTPQHDHLDIEVSVYEGEGATVNVYGKNLLPDDIYNINNWVKVPYNTSTAAIYDLELKNNVKYTISGNISKNGAYVYFFKRLKGTNHESENSEAKMLEYLVSGTSNFTNYTFTADDKYVYYVWLWSLNLSNSLSTLTNLQLEVDTATDYEPYKEPVTYTADANGEINIPSQYPAMTIIPDLDVELSVEYNRDINKAFAELTSAIISMGGNL
ncbi:MAG: tail fiber protein [Clostridia bacterium]|nr:tail fiber protein [Clostridia bacterium]